MTKPPVALSVLAAGLFLAACGGSSSPSTQPSTGTSSTPPTSAAPTGTAPADPAAAKAQVIANWQKFFNYKTPEAQAKALLEDGSSLGAALTLAKQERDQTHLKQGAKVKIVTFTSATNASVTYELLNGTQPLLNQASGVAVLVDGQWKVSKNTFCSLVTLGNNGKSPAGC
jgi:hypothetical protein